MKLFLVGDGPHALVVNNQLTVLGFPAAFFVGKDSEEAFVDGLRGSEANFDRALRFHVAIGNIGTRKAIESISFAIIG
jgi:hypothetical protein